MLRSDDSGVFLQGPHGALPVAQDDEITFKLAMLFEGECEGLGPIAAARKFSAHLALVRGPIDPEREVLVRVHEPLSVLDALDADLSTHSWRLPRALERIAAAGSGVVLLLNCGESADGLLARFTTLAQIDHGAVPDQRSARMDLRTYGVGAQILRDLNVVKMRLLARRRKMPSMAGFGLHTTGFIED